jgi:tRNA(Arg) A34 adenosine deaminase TadA
MEFTLTLPDWAITENQRLATAGPFLTLEARMTEVIRFSRLNFEKGTGGPFAAGVFERESGKLVLIGVNRVVVSNCSSAHAEVMALSLAEKQLGTFDLGGTNMPAHQLVVNWMPCAMCFGAVLWSGVRSLVIAGSGPELEQITGFDEGPIHPDWERELGKRGIEVINNVMSAEAVAVFRDFASSGALVYNGRGGQTNSGGK